MVPPCADRLHYGYKISSSMYSEHCLVCTSKGRQNQYLLSETLTVRVGLCMYMIYTQGQNEEYVLSRSMY